MPCVQGLAETAELETEAVVSIAPLLPTDRPFGPQKGTFTIYYKGKKSFTAGIFGHAMGSLSSFAIGIPGLGPLMAAYYARSALRSAVFSYKVGDKEQTITFDNQVAEQIIRGIQEQRELIRKEHPKKELHYSEATALKLDFETAWVHHHKAPSTRRHNLTSADAVIAAQHSEWTIERTLFNRNILPSCEGVFGRFSPPKFLQ